jgi:bile acid-coenzyme A ligase
MHRQGSVGRPVRDTEVRVLDLDGNDLPSGEIGEIFLRSASYGGSTYIRGGSQLQTTEDGFGSVGDVGYLDGDGFLYLVDRRVDLIITVVPTCSLPRSRRRSWSTPRSPTSW